MAAAWSQLALTISAGERAPTVRAAAVAGAPAKPCHTALYTREPRAPRLLPFYLSRACRGRRWPPLIDVDSDVSGALDLSESPPRRQESIQGT